MIYLHVHGAHSFACIMHHEPANLLVSLPPMHAHTRSPTSPIDFPASLPLSMVLVKPHDDGPQAPLAVLLLRPPRAQRMQLVQDGRSESSLTQRQWKPTAPLVILLAHEVSSSILEFARVVSAVSSTPLGRVW
jgi:hypothetical protein